MYYRILAGLIVIVSCGFLLPTAYVQSRPINRIDTVFQDSLTLQDSIQRIIDRHGAALDQYDENTYIVEHRNLLINDTIQGEKIRSNTAIAELHSGIDAILTSLAFDSTRKQKNVKDILDILKGKFRFIFDEEENIKLQESRLTKALSEFNAHEQSLNKIKPNHRKVLDSVYALMDRDSLSFSFEYRYKGINYLVCIADKNKHDVHVQENNTKVLQPLRRGWTLQKGKKPIAIMNAGMYEHDGSAKGLLIVNGKVIKPIDLTTKKIKDQNFYLYPNGVFYIDSLGMYRVEETQAFQARYGPSKYKGIAYATQSGPMLLNLGKGNPAFGYRSSNRNIRNGVGVVVRSKGARVAFVISKDLCTFQEFASFYRDILGCENALYLDGAISKMYVEWKGKKHGSLEGNLGPTIIVCEKN